MQNTMVRGAGGAMASRGKNEIRSQAKKRKKGEKITLKKGGKALKMHLFGL